MINYWTIFAAPIAAIPVLRFKQKMKFLLPVFIAILVIISMVNVSRDPLLMNYEYYWDETDIEAIYWLCSQEGKFHINHSENSFTRLSKESTYYRLIGIIKNKYNIPCKITRSRGDGKLVYKQGYLTIYRLD